MGFLEHLEELRTRLIRSLIAIAVGAVASLAYSRQIGDFVLDTTVGPSATLSIGRPGEGLGFYFDVALICGVILSAPFVSYQVWRFIAPGLYAREKRMVVPLVLMSIAGTAAGAVFSHAYLFPSTMDFFEQFSGTRMIWLPRVDDTFSLYKTLMLGMVVVFQMPTLVLFLARLRLVTARFLWRHVKYAVLISFVAAAVLTSSPDPVNQAVMAAPMIVMYLASIGIAWLAHPSGGADAARSAGVGLVISAAVFEQVRRHRLLMRTRT
jgi:sec-independent protein translocase protein TatC